MLCNVVSALARCAEPTRECWQLVSGPLRKIAKLDPRQAPEFVDYAAFITLPIN